MVYLGSPSGSLSENLLQTLLVLVTHQFFALSVHLCLPLLQSLFMWIHLMWPSSRLPFDGRAAKFCADIVRQIFACDSSDCSPHTMLVWPNTNANTYNKYKQTNTNAKKYAKYGCWLDLLTTLDFTLSPVLPSFLKQDNKVCNIVDCATVYISTIFWQTPWLGNCFLHNLMEHCMHWRKQATTKGCWPTYGKAKCNLLNWKRK